MTCKEPIPDSSIWLDKKEAGRSPFIPCLLSRHFVTKYKLNVTASVYSLDRQTLRHLLEFIVSLDGEFL